MSSDQCGTGQHERRRLGPICREYQAKRCPKSLCQTYEGWAAAAIRARVRRLRDRDRLRRSGRIQDQASRLSSPGDSINSRGWTNTRCGTPNRITDSTVAARSSDVGATTAEIRTLVDPPAWSGSADTRL